MNVKTLYVKQFRNISDQQIEFENGINLLTGANAQGKTNCAEAIFFLCTGYSPRANRDKVIVRLGEQTAEIEGTASSSYGDVSVKINFNVNDKKSVFINGMQILKIGEIFGNIYSVFFYVSLIFLRHIFSLSVFGFFDF